MAISFIDFIMVQCNSKYVWLNLNGWDIHRRISASYA